MRHIISTMGIALILGINDTNTIWWYIGNEFGVHHDINSHNGMMMNRVQVYASPNPTKQK